MWATFFIASIFFNVILLFKNRELKDQLKHYKNLAKIKSKPVYHESPRPTEVAQDLVDVVTKVPDPQLTALEIELDNDIILPEEPLDSTLEWQVQDSTPLKRKITVQKETALSSVLQSVSGWHKVFIPFLLQNIGWFIGILCFISGSIFLVSYTQGFSKNLTISYTILSYTLLLAWGGYHLKKKVAHAADSGMVLLAISFLLIPLNFSALARLLTISLDNGLLSISFIIAFISTVIASALLFYVSKLISGLFNRQLLTHFFLLFFVLSSLQFVIPVIGDAHSIVLQLLVFAVIMLLLLLAIVYYLPVILQQVFVDKTYLVLFSVGSLIFAAVVSMVHLTLSSPVSIALSFYAPFILFISMLLFYMDEQLHHYKQQGGLLSYVSLICYAVSFLAIVVSFDSSIIRIITMALASILYLRLMWIYRSLVPLYLVLILTFFIYNDIIVSNYYTNEQWLYMAILPLLLGYFSLFIVLIKNDNKKRLKSLQLAFHLLHFIFISSIMSGLISQWFTQTNTALGGFSSLFTLFILPASLYFLLRSDKVAAFKLFGLKYHSLYCYLVILLPGVLILINAFISAELKLLLLTVISLLYTLNSHYHLIRFYNKFTQQACVSCTERSIFINSSLLLSLLLLILVAISFSVSLKMAFLFFVLALNSLFLSLSLYNRALFYIFMLLLSLAAVIVKLYLGTPPSAGLMLSFIILLLFILVCFLDKNKNTELEVMHVNKIRSNTPEKLLWFYPVNDFLLCSDAKEGIDNV